MNISGEEAIERSEDCSLGAVRRVAAMLDQDPDAFEEGQELPKGWHFFLLGAATPRSRLRSDGFPGLGIPMPDHGLPHLLQVSRNVRYHGSILIGSNVKRKSRLLSLETKETKKGPVIKIFLEHLLFSTNNSDLLISETQSFLLLEKNEPSLRKQCKNIMPEFEFKEETTPDDTLLFQYSALTFNSHKIHIDKKYATEIEGHSNLVVNGGLIALLMTEKIKSLFGDSLAEINISYKAPLYSNEKIVMGIKKDQQKATVTAFNAEGTAASIMEVKL